MVLPARALPRRLPRWDLRYFTRLGCSMTGASYFSLPVALVVFFAFSADFSALASVLVSAFLRAFGGASVSAATFLAAGFLAGALAAGASASAALTAFFSFG